MHKAKPHHLSGVVLVSVEGRRRCARRPSYFEYSLSRLRMSWIHLDNGELLLSDHRHVRASTVDSSPLIGRGSSSYVCHF